MLPLPQVKCFCTNRAPVVTSQGNLLTSVPSEALRHLRRLRQLNLRHNRLRLVHPFAFYGLRLRQLDLGNNVAPLSIHRDAFCGLEPSLTSTNRQLNRPPPDETTADVGETDDLSSGLSELRLDHNGLTTLSACMTTAVWTLKTVDIGGNPLHCDCRLLQLAGSRTSFPGAQCAQPITRAGLFLDRFVPDPHIYTTITLGMFEVALSQLTASKHESEVDFVETSSQARPPDIDWEKSSQQQLHIGIRLWHH